MFFPQNMLKSNIWKKGGERGLPPKPTELPPSSHRRVCAQVAHFWHWSLNFAKNLYFAEISAIFHFFRFFWSFFEVFNDFWTFQSFSMFFSLLRVFQWFDKIFQLLKVLLFLLFFLSIFAGFLFYLLFWMEKLTNLQKRLSTYFLLICISAMKAPISLHHCSNCTNVKISGMLPKLHKSTHLLRILMFSWGGCSF